MIKSPRLLGGNKINHNVDDACHRRRLKWVPSTLGLQLGHSTPWDINTVYWSSRLGVGRQAGGNIKSRGKSTQWPREVRITENELWLKEEGKNYEFV
jgi:hypothetical protein